MEEFTVIKKMVYDKDSGRIEVKDGRAKLVDYRFIEKDIFIDNKKSLKKWAPILDALKISEDAIYERVYSELDPYGEEDWNDNVIVDGFRLFSAVYAEYIQGYGDIYNIYNSYSVGDISQNLLPVSMKILSQLNIRDKKYEIKNNLPITEVSIFIDKPEEFGIFGIDIIQKMESYLIQMLVDKINEEIKDKDTIYIENLALSLSLEQDNKLILKSKYKIL